MDYVGNDVETDRKKSVQECASWLMKLKARNQEVHFWTYNPNTKACKAKGLTNVRTPTDELVSGSAECGQELLAPDFGE